MSSVRGGVRGALLVAICLIQCITGMRYNVAPQQQYAPPPPPGQPSYQNYPSQPPPRQPQPQQQRPPMQQQYQVPSPQQFRPAPPPQQQPPQQPPQQQQQYRPAQPPPPPQYQQQFPPQQHQQHHQGPGMQHQPQPQWGAPQNYGPQNRSPYNPYGQPPPPQQFGPMSPAGQMGQQFPQFNPMPQYGPFSQPGTPFSQPGTPFSQPGAPFSQPGAPFSQPGAPGQYNPYNQAYGSPYAPPYQQQSMWGQRSPAPGYLRAASQYGPPPPQSMGPGGKPPAAGSTQGPDMVPPCQYLSSRVPERTPNTCPFQMTTEFNTPKKAATPGSPIQVTLEPWKNSPYVFSGFTDYIFYAIPDAGAEGTGAAYKPVGRFDLSPEFTYHAPDAQGFQCNIASTDFDAAGNMNEYAAKVFRTRFPGRHSPFNAMQKLVTSLLWVGTDEIKGMTGIKFVAKYKFDGKWCESTTRSIPIYIPPTPQELARRRQREMLAFQRQMQQMQTAGGAGAGPGGPGGQGGPVPETEPEPAVMQQNMQRAVSMQQQMRRLEMQADAAERRANAGGGAAGK